MTASARDPRRAVIAKVQIAKKEMRLDDDTYRDVLKRITGQVSSTACSETQLVALLDEFRRLGWKPKSARPISAVPEVRLIYAIWKDIKPLLDGTPGTAELRGFVRRQTKSDQVPDGVDAPEFCSHAEAVLVIEGLKGWRARLRAGKAS
jgi:hypothetical protein